MQAPQSPNPITTAAAQAGANRDSSISGALINNVNEVTPLGNVAYNRTGSSSYVDASGKTVTVPTFTRTTTLSPSQKGLYDQQVRAGSDLNNLAIGQIGRLNTTMSQPVSTDGLPTAVNQIGGDFSADRRRVEDAIFARQNSQFNRDEDRMRQRLASQGLTPGSEAYNNDVQQFEQAKTDARQQAILAGGQEQSRMFGMEAQAGDFANAARQNAFTERMALRNQPINEISALLGGGQVSMPQFQQPFRQAVGAPDVQGAVGQDYQNRLQSYNNRMSGMFGLGGAALTGLFGLSDRRAKTDIERVGTTNGGLAVYRYRYKGDPQFRLGVMADEVEKVNPRAVRTIGGLKHVDYREVA